MRPFFLLGLTATGKHETAVVLAERWGAEIISIDSMKVYRGMDIGTAKPEASLRARVRHHLIDICDPSETYSAGRFVEDARRAQADIEARGRRVLFVGGTALYYKAYAYGLFAGPPSDPGLRRELVAAGAPALHDELRRVDPAAAARIHPNDLKRLVRAVEVYRKTGRPISALQMQFDRPRLDATVVWLSRPDLKDRVARRVRRMLEQGLVDEVRRLMARPWSREVSSAVGYREIVNHLHGEIGLDEAARLIVRDTLRFARRQAAWFRSFGEALAIEAGESAEETSRAIEEWVRGKGGAPR